MNYWQEPVVIGGKSFPRFMAGPLDGVIDLPFRRIIRSFSPNELLYTEIRHVSSICHVYQKQCLVDPNERPVNFQMSANTTANIERACEIVLGLGVDIIDLNVGCPAKNVVRSGAGSALMADVPRLEEIVKKFRAHVPIPFTVKIRAGYKERNALDVAKRLEQLGADALVVHPRLQSEGFQGIPNYELAREIKETVRIPVLVSGGIVDWESARTVQEQTGVDGFLIGRALIGNPWYLKTLAASAAGQSYVPDRATILSCILQHFEQSVKHEGKYGWSVFKKHLSEYLKQLGLDRVHRSEILCLQDPDQMKVVLEGLKERLVI